MISDCTALILAGGESRRMGQDKAALLLNGQTLLQRVIAVVEPLFSEVIVSTRRVRADCGYGQICDDPAHSGPLAGLSAGLAVTKTRWVFVIACDMPFITPELITQLASLRENFDAVVPVVQGYPQPLAAFYATRILGQLQELQRGEGKQSLRELLTKLTVRYVNETEVQAADLGGFVDLDTPQDVSAAESQMRYKPACQLQSVELSVNFDCNAITRLINCNH